MKNLLKVLARFVALVLVSPALASFAIRSRVMGGDRALQSSSQAFSLLPGVVGTYLRVSYLSRVLAECHASACVEFGALFSKAGTKVGPNAYVGPGCHIGLASIERDVLLAAGVHVPSGSRIHGTASLDTPIRDQPGELAMVRIGEGSWIGSGATIMADVGRGCIVGAGAVVTKPLPDFVVATGVPAKVVRHRGQSSIGLEVGRSGDEPAR